MTIYLTSFIAGMFAILSPCVLTVAPILLLSAFQGHRLAPLAIVAGLTTFFTGFGIIVASTGQLFGLSQENLRNFSAYSLIIIGLILLFPVLQNYMNKMLSPLFGKIQTKTHHYETTGLVSYFFLGCLMALVWVPCTGPSLSLALSFAAKGENIFMSMLIMLCYSLGVSIPLIAVSYLSSQFVSHQKSKWAKVAKVGQKVLGAALLFTGILVITDYDQVFSSFLSRITPEFILRITSQY